VLVGGSATARQIAVRAGATTVTYDVAAGASAADIAAGLRERLAAADLDITAEVDAGGVRLRAVAYGAAASFEYDLDHAGAPAWSAATGTDVVGTIDGVAAIGQGQRLRLLDLSTSSAKGIEIDVPEGVTGAIGSLTYSPGIAQRLTTLAARMTGTDGSLTTTADGYQRRVDGFNDQIARFEDRLERTRSNLVRQWSAIQSVLQGLQSQGSWLDSQLAKQQAS
jgi:flagellar hook-associated protein 2